MNLYYTHYREPIVILQTWGDDEDGFTCEAYWQGESHGRFAKFEEAEAACRRKLSEVVNALPHGLIVG